MNERKYIPGFGPIGAKLMVLSDAPTDKDETIGHGFTDRQTNGLLSEAGINPSSCWLTSVSKYAVPPNIGKKKIPFPIRAKNAGIDIEAQLSDLRNEIQSIKPNCILALGSAAMWGLNGKFQIQDYRGSIQHGSGSKFVATYNPRHLSWQAADIEFMGYWNKQVILFDMKRAKHQATFPELILPSRTLEICQNSAQLAEFCRRYQSFNRMAVDIEAIGLGLPGCIGLSLNKSHGIVLPLWNTDGISTIPDSDLVQCWLIVYEMLLEKDIVGQNFNYDRDKLKRLGFTIRRFISDTMLKAHALNPELLKGLAFNTSIFTEEPFYKNEGMYQGSTRDLLLGCARDACVTLEIDENMEKDLDEIGQRSFFENFLMKLPDMYWSIEQLGFKVDKDERDRLVQKYIEWDEHINYELFKLVGTEVNVNSPKQISILLFDNLKLPRRQGTGEEELTALLNSTTSIKKPEHRKIIELILEGRRVRKSISTYLMALPDFDNRMRTTYYPCLDTGRTSTGQQDPPIRPKLNLKTGEWTNATKQKDCKALGIAFQIMTKHGDIGADIRGMYVPDEEEIFVQADSSQAEARVVWLLADDEEALRLVDEIDYHAWTASWFFGGTESDYSKKVLGYEHPIRFAGKTLRHAGHLGAGKRRAAISVNTDARKYKIPIAITEAIAERALIIFHSKQPKIQQVFQKSVVDILQRTRTLIAPIPYGIDSPVGGRRTFYERWGDELFRKAFSYIPQRAVSDNTKAAGLRIRERIPPIKIVMEAHDSLLFSIPKSKLNMYIPVIKEEFERPISFTRCSIPRRDLVIPCEIETGMNYKDLKKFKDIPLNEVPKYETPKLPPRSVTEQFTVVNLPEDTKLDDLVYEEQRRKLNL
jgi:DNA polymerase I-like protein with 3'-5' exonuclease and polymerase domains/uracil-DNA glycosylase